MSTENTLDRTGPAEASVVAKLSTLDRFLPVWILAAMAVGLVAGRLAPGLGEALGAVAIDGVSAARPPFAPALVNAPRCSKNPSDGGWPSVLFPTRTG